MADICNLCGKAASSMCQRCNETYCSTNCQILDWRVHKKVCIQMPILVPIKDHTSKDINSYLNRTIGSDSPRNRTPNEINKTVKRPLARNPLKIQDEDLPLPLVNANSPDGNQMRTHSDVDFTLKPKVLASKDKEKSIKSNASESSKVDSRISAWKTAYPFPKNEAFDVIVQYVENGENAGIIWVTELKYEGPLRKLLAEINRNIDVNTDRCSSEEIRIGSLIAAPFENLYYRAEIIEVIHVSKMAVVHLIDYGNLVEVAFKDLRSAIPIMRNLNAYAFRMRYTKPIGIEAVLSIRVISIEKSGVAIIEEKTTTPVAIPIGLTIEDFTESPTVSLVKISNNGKYALLCLNNDLVTKQLKEMDQSIVNGESCAELCLKNTPKDGDYVTARTVNGWNRALVMSTYRNYYLVYLIDVGRIALVEQVQNVAEKYKSIAMQVFAVELKKILVEGNDLRDCLFPNKMCTIKAQTITKSVNARIPCFLVSRDGSKLAEVEVFNYLGECQDIDSQDWVEPLLFGSIVHITSIHSHMEIFISLVCTKLYVKIFSAAAEDCEPLLSGKSKKGDLVLAKNNNEYFRAKILEATAADIVKVVNVDTGIISTVSSQTMRKPNMFVLSCPYHTRKVKLMYLSNVATPYADNKALAKLEQCQKGGAEFSLSFDSSPELGVELLLKTADQQSLNKQLLPLLFEKRSDTVPTPSNAVESLTLTTPPPSPKEDDQSKTVKYALKDLEIIPISAGDNVPVMVLDSSTITKGYITGCDFTNKDFLMKLESDYLPQIAKYCASSITETEYSPSPDELCLAVYDVDKEWYRAMCLDQMKDDMFYVMFLDYGNMCRVHKSNIRQMTPELMFPANANMCIFDGVPDVLPSAMCEKFLTATQSNPIITAKVTRLQQDSYLLQIKNKEKYF